MSVARHLSGGLVALAAGLIGAGLTLAGPVASEPITAEIGTAAVVRTTAVPAHNLHDARTHAVVPVNSWQQDVLSRSSQKNWYRLKISSRSYVHTLLGSLPANYNLRLYNASGTLLSSSDRGSLRSEKVARMLKAGTYYLRVGSTKGAAAGKKYALLVRVVRAGSTVGVLTAKVGNSDMVVGDFVNVSKQTMTVGHVNLTFYGAKGKVLRRLSDTNNRLWIPMAPGARAPFNVSTGNVPESVLRKTKRVVVVPRWSVMPTRTAAKLSVSHLEAPGCGTPAGPR